MKGKVGGDVGESDGWKGNIERFWFMKMYLKIG